MRQPPEVVLTIGGGRCCAVLRFVTFMFHLLHPDLWERRDDTTGVTAFGGRGRPRRRAGGGHGGGGGGGPAVAVGLAGFTEAQAGETAPAARVWVTTVDQAELMHERAPVAFGRP